MEKFAAAAAATASPPKIRMKICQFKGCRKTSDDCKIVNHGCPDHHAFMKDKNTKQGKAYYAKKKATLHKQFDFSLCSTLVNNAAFWKYDSHKTDVIKYAAINKGKLPGLTMGERTPYFLF